MKKRQVFLMTAAVLLCSAVIVKASIIEFGEEKIVLSPSTVKKGFTWSENLQMTENGLVSEKLAENEVRESWIQTYPIAVGLSWRPPRVASFGVFFDGSIGDMDLQSKLDTQIFLRYSCDKTNWSTWYKFESAGRKSGNGSRLFESTVWLPRSASQSYDDLMQVWWKSKPVWSSDENEFCEWLQKKDRDFFVREKPFIGYVQLRIEKTTTNRIETVRGMTVQYLWNVGGVATIPADQAKVRKNTDAKWFFQTKEK